MGAASYSLLMGGELFPFDGRRALPGRAHHPPLIWLPNLVLSRSLWLSTLDVPRKALGWRALPGRSLHPPPCQKGKPYHAGGHHDLSPQDYLAYPMYTGSWGTGSSCLGVASSSGKSSPPKGLRWRCQSGEQLLSRGRVDHLKLRGGELS